MTAEMKTSEVLDLAADVIEERGWTTGHWNNTSADRPVCIEGGIAAALGVTIDLGSFPEGVGGYEAFRSCPAYAAVREYLNLPRGYALYHWNDAVAEPSHYVGDHELSPVKYAHSKEEVIEVLRAAAAVERAKEESLEHSGVTA